MKGCCGMGGCRCEGEDGRGEVNGFGGVGGMWKFDWGLSGRVG